MRIIRASRRWLALSAVVIVAAFVVTVGYVRPHVRDSQERHSCRTSFADLHASVEDASLQGGRAFRLVLQGPAASDLVEWSGVLDLSSDAVLFDLDRGDERDGDVMFRGSTVLVRNVEGSWEDGLPPTEAVVPVESQPVLSEFEPGSALDPRQLIESVRTATGIGLSSACETPGPDGERILHAAIALGDDAELFTATLDAGGHVVELGALRTTGGIARFVLDGAATVPGVSRDEDPAP